MQIKRYLRNIMLRGILSVCMLLGIVIRVYASLNTFNTNVHCTVRGHLYLDKFKVFSLIRDDYCTVINQQLNGDFVILWSSTHWVVFLLPKENFDVITFWYIWGSGKAFINYKEVDVDWGYVMRG